MVFGLKRRAAPILILGIIDLFLFSSTNGFITEIAVRFNMKGHKAAPGAPWPLPKNWANSTIYKTLDPHTITMETNAPNCDIMTEAFKRYRQHFTLDSKGSKESNVANLNKLVVNVGKQETCRTNVYPNINMKESYWLEKSGIEADHELIRRYFGNNNFLNNIMPVDSLAITSDENAVIEAEEIWGALRGLETFSQLIYLTGEKKYRINNTNILDEPRFRHRGLMVDTARHFVPMKIFLQIIDAMSWDKLNVLHWHAVDDQSFPYPIKVFNNMSLLGSYSATHRYSTDDVNRLKLECRLRGIRLIPEFDTPGHSFSWGKSLPMLITPCWGKGAPYTPNHPVHGAMELINPILEYTYETLEKIFAEIINDFPDQYLHLGFDEAYHACWESNPNITDLMNQFNISSYNEVESYYENRLMETLEKYNATYVIWQDPIDRNITFPPSTIVQVWKDTSNSPNFKNWESYAKHVAQIGTYDMLISSPWYMNVMTFPLRTEWRKFYEIEPTNFTDVPEEKNRVIGGEACIWLEYEDGTSILSTLWPRVSTVAERLWSQESVRDTDSAQYRLDQQRCRMLRRKVPARPFLPGYCGDYDWGLQEDPKPSKGHLVTASMFLAILWATVAKTV